MRRRSIYVPGLDHGDQPFPMACAVERLLQTSAVHAMNPDDGSFATSGEHQVVQAFRNAERVLQAAGARFDDVSSVDILIADNALRDAVNTSWIEAFPDPDSRPVRHTSVQPLRPPLLIQLKLTALLSEDHT